MSYSASCGDPTLLGPATYSGRAFTATSLETQPAFWFPNVGQYPFVMTNPVGSGRYAFVVEIAVAAVPMIVRGMLGPEALYPGPILIFAQTDTTATSPSGGVPVPAVPDFFANLMGFASGMSVLSGQSHNNGGPSVGGKVSTVGVVGSFGASGAIEPQPMACAYDVAGSFGLAPGTSIMLQGPQVPVPMPPMMGGPPPSGTLRFKFTWIEIPIEEANCLLA